MATITDAIATATRAYTAGNLAQAEQFSWSVLSAEPNHAEALHLLGLIAQRKGNWGQAIDYLNRSILCDGGNAVTWKNLGDARLATGDLRAGAANYEQALRLWPEFADACQNLGIALQHLGHLDRACACYRDVLRLLPSSAQAHNNLGNTLKAQGKLPEACASFEDALRLEPDNPDIAYNLGTTLHEQGQLDRAVDYYRQALRLRPNFPNASNNLATALKEQGSLDESIAQFRETLKLKPDHALAYYNLSELAVVGRYTFASEEIEGIKAFMASGRCSPLERSLCAFTLASVLNKQGSYDEAFGYYRQANDLRRGLLQERNKAFDPQKHAALVDRIIATYDRAYSERIKGWGVDSDVPVFIIGMPRSGSTLVEQILASHPQVFGAGELGEIPLFFAKLAAESNADLYTTVVPRDQAAARNLATGYLEGIARLGQGAARVTIKTLENILHVGVIATLFPRARIIHCRRDPLDVCLSCYFQNFQELVFTWSLEDIGAYYLAYEKLMAHWARVLPARIHEVCYEEMVHNQETVSRALLAFCGLEWDERCLAFFNTRRVVRTASTVQVRKPVSAQAIDRWKRYRSHLGPLLKALGRSAEGEAEAFPESRGTAQAVPEEEEPKNLVSPPTVQPGWESANP